jgi:hypothetical protein
MNIASKVTDIGIITLPKALYIPGKMFDMVSMMSENIWHVQHVEKKLYASCKLTGATLRHTDTPMMPTPTAAAPITNGATAPADIGIIATNNIHIFFNVFMLFIIP